MSKSLLFIIVVTLLSVSIVAQDADMCPVLVTDALTTVDEVCAGIGRNEVCYGHNLVSVVRFDESPLEDFIEPGRIADIATIQSIETAALNIDESVWGVAVLSLQANIPDSLPGENVTFVVFGDTQITADDSVEDERYGAPMQAFRFSSGLGELACEEAPRDGLLVQSQGDTIVYFSINGVEVELGSTAYFTASEDELLSTTVIEGQVTLTHDGESQTALAGETINIATEESPAPPVPHTPEDVERVPVEVLPDVVNLPVVVSGLDGSVGWVDSGIAVEAGQTFAIAAHGEVTIWPGCWDACPEEQPLGNEDGPVYIPSCTALCNAVTTGPGGSVPIGTVARGAEGGYIFPNQPIGALIGRIGDGGAPFFIGGGGTFVADASGTVQLHVHEDDNSKGDETGQFTVTINVIPAG